MRVLVIFCSLLSIGLANPQYNYDTGVSGIFGGFSRGLISSTFDGLTSSSSESNGFSSGSSFGEDTSLRSGSDSMVRGSSVGIEGSSPFSDSSFAGASHFQDVGGSHGARFEAPLVHKQFITVAAPEDNDSLSKSKHLVIGRPQQNYRVVFIKTPSASSSNVKLSTEYAPKDEKTVIYVLSKKDNSLEVNDIATPAPTVARKPEVFFIKYKTEAEAQHAQREIQAEYDKIKGSSEHTNVGVAPQQSVVGILGDVVSGADSFSTGSSSSSGSGAVSPDSFVRGDFSLNAVSSDALGDQNSAYLPPSSL